jgi:hypothetical protein
MRKLISKGYQYKQITSINTNFSHLWSKSDTKSSEEKYAPRKDQEKQHESEERNKNPK